jgi:hypothetical protein
MYDINLIIVVNINNNICENVLLSHIHASNRWNCKYMVEQREYDLFKDCYPSWNKIGILFDETYDKFDNIMILDSDVLIHIDAPSPFKIIDHNKFNVVRDSHYKFIKEKNKLNTYIKNYITPHYEYLQKHDSSINHSFIENYFNSGMMIYSPTLFQKNSDITHYQKIISDSISNGTSHREQGIINYMVQREFEINFLNETWNVTNPNIKEDMSGYIYHFTGDNWDYLKKMVKTYDWKTNNNFIQHE